ncbi:hypothetical protein BDZ85DRAFT_320506 [Elsinoe ampelina]|uniref:Uncharacterized protein n=1 Tax=Elsinoe ampelina TaxID=302913 RepID=A0A6A6G691_9PEZI|nr:hypothetical protein BDZ85DRAFT_320506 [Elsinoe ampelina]
MSTASEQRAWRTNRPASISRPAVPHPRSSAASPTTTSGATTPNPALPKPQHSESKPLATVKPVEQTKTTPAPAPASNFWDQRKQAQQQARSTGTVTPKEGASAMAESGEGGGRKNEVAVPTGQVVGREEGNGSVNGFNAGEVKDFLKREAGAFKTYRVAESNPKPASAGSRGNMAGGQSFLAALGKQIAQLQG